MLGQLALEILQIPLYLPPFLPYITEIISMDDCAQLYISSEDLNSDPHALAARTLPTEPPPVQYLNIFNSI